MGHGSRDVACAGEGVFGKDSDGNAFLEPRIVDDYFFLAEWVR